MKKELLVVLCTTLATIVSGCTSVRGPSGSKFDLKTVCNTSAGSKCSPTLGRKMALLKQQITLETTVIPGTNGVPDDIKPRLETYLGTITQRGIKRFGEPGAYCGKDGTMESPFSASDIEPFYANVYTNNVTVEATFGRNSRLGFAADIKKALGLAGVSDKVIKNLKSKIKTESQKLSTRASSSSFQFVEYRIKEEALRRLEGAKTNDNNTAMKNCINTLLYDGGMKGKGWRMYQSLTGLKVTKNTAEYASSSRLSGEFRIAVEDALEAEGTLVPQAISEKGTDTNNTPDEARGLATSRVGSASKNTNCPVLGSGLTSAELGGSIAKIDATFEQTRCNSSTGDSDAYFVVLGVSFWRSPRYPQIN